jgi:hypothetical protein
VINERQMINIVRTIAVAALAATCGGCWESVYDTPGAEYLHRSDTITLSAGNAQNINATTHIIDPWPRHVANRKIPANGERMSHAIDRYKGGQAPASSGQTGAQVIAIPVGSATPSQSSSGTPAQ